MRSSQNSKACLFQCLGKGWDAPKCMHRHAYRGRACCRAAGRAREQPPPPWTGWGRRGTKIPAAPREIKAHKRHATSPGCSSDQLPSGGAAIPAWAQAKISFVQQILNTPKPLPEALPRSRVPHAGRLPSELRPPLPARPASPRA